MASILLGWLARGSSMARGHLEDQLGSTQDWWVIMIFVPMKLILNKDIFGYIIEKIMGTIHYIYVYIY